IFCAAADTLDSRDEIYSQALADIWIKPYSKSFVSFKLRKLFEQIKITKDRNLAQGYIETAINSISSLIWFKDIRGAHLKVNDSFYRAVGKTKEDIEGRGHYYIWDMKNEEYEQGEYICLESEEIVLQEKKTCIFDEKVKAKHGMRQFKTYKSPIFDDNEQLIGTVGIVHDVTDLENMGAELEVILRNLPFAVLLTNEAGKIINVNDVCAQYFATEKEALIGQEYQQWKRQNLAHMSEINAKGYADTKIVVGKREKNLEIYEKPIFDVFGTAVGMLYMCRDVTVERHLEKKIIYSANTD
ncbi:MAG: PAS domain S-box protein, partial [Acidaminococcaceae bacterium]|nr:PAS domain S-box protein [Acidaminococcaceae bacterium]